MDLGFFGSIPRLQVDMYFVMTLAYAIHTNMAFGSSPGYISERQRQKTKFHTDIREAHAVRSMFFKYAFPYISPINILKAIFHVSMPMPIGLRTVPDASATFINARRQVFHTMSIIHTHCRKLKDCFAGISARKKALVVEFSVVDRGLVQETMGG